MVLRYLLIAAACISLVGCGENEPVIDASSVASYQRSLKEVKATLPKDDHELFDDSVQALTGNLLMQLILSASSDQPTSRTCPKHLNY